MRQRWSHERLRFRHRCVVGTLLVHAQLTGCEKESEAIVSIALYPTNTNILLRAPRQTASPSMAIEDNYKRYWLARWIRFHLTERS